MLVVYLRWLWAFPAKGLLFLSLVALASFALVFVACAQTMTVSPPQPVALHAPQKAAEPTTFTFHVDADRTTNWIVTGLPSWLVADATFGRTPADVTFTVKPDGLRVGWSYGLTLRFTNLRNHQGDTARGFVVLVQPEGWTSVTDAGPLVCGEVLAGDVAVQPYYCLDDDGARLLAK